jgi:hypothetical protein
LYLERILHTYAWNYREYEGQQYNRRCNSTRHYETNARLEENSSERKWVCVCVSHLRAVSLPIPEVAPVIITDNRCAVRENAMIRANGDGRMDDNNM